MIDLFGNDFYSGQNFYCWGVFFWTSVVFYFLLNSGIVIFGFVYVQKATSQDAVIKISLSFKRENLKMEVDSCQSVKPKNVRIKSNRDLKI